jgi:hypothetical protein
MKTPLIENPIEVTNRLDALGLTREMLVEVIESMVAGRNSCTENDPPGAPGYMSWKEGTRRLREVCLVQDWERNNDNFVYSVFDRKRNIKLAVCNADDGTGLAESQPQNRSKKGAATDYAVSTNQLNFYDKLEVNVIQLSPETTGGVVYWYLCVYCEGDIARAELSCPTACENGFFTDFKERVLITREDGAGGLRVRREAPDNDSGFEINVVRKKA